MLLNENTSRKINFSLDLISFGTLCTVAFFNQNHADPGDFIFLFVFENLILLFSFFAFFILFYAGHSYYLKKINLPTQDKKTAGILQTLIGILLVFGLSYGILIFFNQLTIELLVGFLKDNAYHFKSIEILSQNGMFFESQTLNQLQDLFAKDYTIFIWVIALKQLINLTINFFSRQDLKTNLFASLSGAITLITQTLLSPICIFIACTLLVVLSEIYGAQSWIILLTLSVFRILFWISTYKLSQFFKRI